MTDIQEQLKQHLKDFAPPSEIDDGAFSSSTLCLLRAFLEECCKAGCKYCLDEQAVPRYSETAKAYWHPDEDNPERGPYCEATKIREYLAWLEEKP